MIKCSNCGSLNMEVSQVCGNCGANLINNVNQNNINSMEQNTMQNASNINNLNQSDVNNNQWQNNYQNQMYQQANIQNNRLVDAYIGNNADKLRNGTFSWCSLLFGGFYFWYRKMYSYLGIWIGINVVLALVEKLIVSVFLIKFVTTLDEVKTMTNTIETIFDIIGYIVILIMAFPFKSSYVQHVKEKVLIIINKNPNKTEAELMEICKRQGGTTSAPFIFFASLFVIAFIIGYVI